MSDSSDPGGTGDGPGRGPTPGLPRWVKVSAIIGAVLVVLFAVLLLTGAGGEHGPGRHTSSRNGSAAPVAAPAVSGIGEHPSPAAGRQPR